MAEKMISCDACGKLFNAASNKSCPACGAGYEYDEETRPETAVERKYRLMEERQEAERKANFEKRQAELDGQVKKIKAGCLIVVLVIAALIAVPIIMANSGGEEAALLLKSVVC